MGFHLRAVPFLDGVYDGGCGDATAGGRYRRAVVQWRSARSFDRTTPSAAPRAFSTFGDDQTEQQSGHRPSEISRSHIRTARVVIHGRDRSTDRRHGGRRPERTAIHPLRLGQDRDGGGRQAGEGGEGRGGGGEKIIENLRRRVRAGSASVRGRGRGAPQARCAAGGEGCVAREGRRGSRRQAHRRRRPRRHPGVHHLRRSRQRQKRRPHQRRPRLRLYHRSKRTMRQALHRRLHSMRGQGGRAHRHAVRGGLELRRLLNGRHDTAVHDTSRRVRGSAPAV